MKALKCSWFFIATPSVLLTYCELLRFFSTDLKFWSYKNLQYALRLDGLGKVTVLVIIAFGHHTFVETSFGWVFFPKDLSCQSMVGSWWSSPLIWAWRLETMDHEGLKLNNFTMNAGRPTKPIENEVQVLKDFENDQNTHWHWSC